MQVVNALFLRKNVGDPYAEVFIDDHDFPSGDQFAVQQNSSGSSVSFSSSMTEPVLKDKMSLMVFLVRPNTTLRSNGTSRIKSKLSPSFTPLEANV